MPGLNLGAHASIRGTTASQSPATSVNQAAFGPQATRAAPTNLDILKPNDGFGVAFWTGIAAIGLLILVRRSLPN